MSNTSSTTKIYSIERETKAKKRRNIAKTQFRLSHFSAAQCSVTLHLLRKQLSLVNCSSSALSCTLPFRVFCIQRTIFRTAKPLIGLSAKHKLDNYYAMRGAVPELYKNRFVNDAAIDILHSGVYLPLPTPIAPDGPRIHISRYGVFDSSKYSMSDIIKVRTMLGDIQFREDDNAMVMGFLEVIDFKGVGPGHIFHFNAVLVKKIAVLGDKAWPYRPKGFHFVNVNSSCEKIMSLAKGMMSDKIKKRFHIHSNFESLYEHIPKECLPAEYGGCNGTLADGIKEWETKLLNYKQYFEEDAKYGTNEKLRRGRPVNSESLFGIDGSFRKLDID